MLFVFRKYLVDLFLALKLKKICEDIDLWIIYYKAEPITTIEDLVDEEIKKRMNKIPSDTIPLIKKAFNELKIPKRREIKIIDTITVV